MKINEIITEGILGSIGKGLADIVAPGAIEKYQAAKSSQAVGQQAQTSQIAQQNRLRQTFKYDKFVDLYAPRIPTVNGVKTTSMQDIAQQLPKSLDSNRRWKAVMYVAQQLEKKGIKVTKSPTAPTAQMKSAPSAVSPVNINTIRGMPKAGLPTPAEQAKLQATLKTAMDT